MDFFNGPEMSKFRLDLLSGNPSDKCSACYYEDKFNKLTGRTKQLLKSGITFDNFPDKTRASPHYNNFKYSWENSGNSDYYPVDLQINLGNTCNSSCIMCSPQYSSRLENEYKSLNKLQPDMFNASSRSRSWTRDDALVDKFVEELGQIPRLNYIHLLGGETLYDPAFYKICDKLIENGLSKNVIIGTTTNCTVYNEKIEHYVKNFKQFHLGVSIETVTELNDYIRHPSKITNVLDIVNKFKMLRDNNQNLFLNLRITPNIFTIYEFDLLARFMIENKLSAESCNILTKPSVLRMELLPDDIRQETITKFKTLIDDYSLQKDPSLVNIRNYHLIDQNISNTIIEYYDFLCNYKSSFNVENDRYNLIKFLKAFEQIHNNRITEYAPRYTEFLRHYGY
jgi:hypothetical protein